MDNKTASPVCGWRPWFQALDWHGKQGRPPVGMGTLPDRTI